MFHSEMQKTAYDLAVPQHFIVKSAIDDEAAAVQRAALPPAKDVGPAGREIPAGLLSESNDTAVGPKSADVLLQELPNDWTFTEDDMVDWLGRKYSILIWGKNRGVPGYRADPEVCLGNVSCKITYLYSDKDDSHAVVFRHNVGIGDSGARR